ncbi:MAG: tetratricopeptide repeat protein, partial [Anaerolineaceae bacterium]
MISISWDIWYGQGELFFLHLTNFFIHTLCFLAVFLMIYVLSKHSQEYAQSKEFIPHAVELALWIAGLWALHPFQTNAVTYLVQRMASLVTLFYVLSVANYFIGRTIHLQKNNLNIRSVVFYALSSMCMILAFLSKPNAAMIPVMLFFTEAWFFQPDIFQRIFHFARKHWLLSATCVLMVCAVTANVLPPMLSSYNTRHFTLFERLLTEARVILRYISVLIYPDPNRLSLEHDVVLSTSILHPLTTLPSILCLVAITVGIIVYRRRFPIITYGILWFLLNLVIESSIIPLELTFEHRMYLPSVGLILALVVAVFNISHSFFWKVSAKDFIKISWCVVAIMASALTLATFQRNKAWEDSVTLNQDSALKAPNNPRAHSNLAVALVRAQRYEEAIQEANIALRLGKEHFEQYSVAANSIITSYTAMGKYSAAISEGERLLKEWPKDSDARAWPGMSLNLASAYLGNHDLKGAYMATRDALVHNLLLPTPEPYY